ncbi:remorin [Daucus carota subsp. sativus]|uniref:remorin n=1 Tax=Daucus carota subsp. sativus TaxID=79200 RepID=UPI0007EFC512|nr:PREDICTED: remorin [Daucus carota subsp. sativus]
MENLIKQQQQKRVKNSGGQAGREVANARGTKLPLQQTESFKRDKRTQNWFQRQFSNQMSPGYDSEDGDHATAIAAATFAIYSNDESRGGYNQKINRQGPNSPSPRVNTRKEDPIRFPEPGRVSRRPSSNNTRGRQDSSIRRPGGRESSRPATPATENEILIRSSTQGRNGNTRAEAWEKAENAKIQKRYEKMSSHILAWENEKKQKAKLQMERRKGELERRRARNSQHYQFKLAKIDNIAEGARAQLEEKRKNDKIKVQERAKKMKSSGKVHTSCLCF